MNPPSPVNTRVERPSPGSFSLKARQRSNTSKLRTREAVHRDLVLDYAHLRQPHNAADPREVAVSIGLFGRDCGIHAVTPA